MSMWLDRDLVLRRPLSAGLNELIRRRVLRSTTWGEWTDSEETERRGRFPSMSPPRSDGFPFSMRFGDREREGERFVEMVDTESESEK